MMLKPRPETFFFLSFLLVATIPGSALAQPLGRHHLSVESLIAPAEFVAIGSIQSVKENVIVVPGTIDKSGIPDERGKFEYVLKTKFTETLKKVNQAGDDGEFETFRTLDHNAGKNEQLARWAENGTAGLWLIHPKYQTEEFHRWEFIPFNEQGVNHFGYQSSSLQPPMFASDLSILTTPEEISSRIRDYGPISQMEFDPDKPSVVSVRIPYAILGPLESGDFNQLTLPIDSESPKIARRLIQSPGDFVSPQDAARDPRALDMLCEAGIDLLGEVKTESNIKLLEDCLDNSILPFKHSANDYRIRTKAYERLLDWRVNPPRPKFGKNVSRLFLANTDINDDTLALVAEFENLETVYLWQTKISHVGIEHLAKLKKLRLLELSDEVITDEMLRTLRKNGQLHLIAQATTEDEQIRPGSIEEVARLDFWCAPFTDTALKEFTDFKNLTVIELGRMNITDAAIEHLAKFKKLKFALLNETAITKQGTAQLRIALPNCSVEVR